MRLSISAAVCLLSVPVAASAASIGVLQGLGAAPGVELGSVVYAMSPEGSVVAGVRDVGTGTWNPFTWSAETGVMTPMPLTPYGDMSALPYSIASEGRAIVGMFNRGTWEAFRWTPEMGYQQLGFLPSNVQTSFASGVSADGTRVVGASLRTVNHPVYGSSESEEAFLWTPDHGMVGLGFPADAPFLRSRAMSISGDGSVITGHASFGEFQKAFRWTEQTGMETIGVLPGKIWSEAWNISFDGSAIIGRSGDFALYGEQAFHWTAEKGMQEIPALGDLWLMAATGVSGDGSIVVGGAGSFESMGQAFIWTSERGTRALIDMLREADVTGLDGWTLSEARSVSADGLTFSGTGINPLGQSESWIVTIPSPASAALFIGFIFPRKRSR